jgi:hypothetical protein
MTVFHVNSKNMYQKYINYKLKETVLSSYQTVFYTKYYINIFLRNM